MDIVKKIKIQRYAVFAVALGVAVLAGFGVVRAYQGIAPNILLESGSVLNYNEAPRSVPVEESLGSVFLTPCENNNGLESCYFSEAFAEATTTLFAIQNPWGATSTVDFLVLQGRTGSTSAGIYI